MTERLERLGTVDLVDLAMEQRDAAINVGALMRLQGSRLLTDGTLRLTEIRAELAAHVAGTPRLRQVVHWPGPGAGRPLWIDDPAFDIDWHVRQLRRVPPVGEPDLLSLTAKLVSTRLDRSRPLWRMWFVTGLPDDDVAVVMALHHVVADGTAALQLLGRLFGPTTDSPTPMRVDRPRWLELVRDNVGQRFATMTRLRLPARLPRWGAATDVLARTWRSPRTSLNQPVGPHRTLDVLRLELASVRRVGHAHGGTVNDVVLTLAAGGLRSLLRSRGERTAGVVLNAGVPVSLRPPGEPAGPGNRTGLVLVGLPMDEPDPGRRLRRVHAASVQARGHQPPTAANSVLLWLSRFGLLRAAGRHQRLTHVVESDVIGPRQPLRLLGAPVLDVVPVGNLAGNVGIAFLALSYLDHLVLTVQVDSAQAAGMPALMVAMREDWARLDAANGTTTGDQRP